MEIWSETTFIILLAVMGWIALTYLIAPYIAAFTGWRRLAEFYHANVPFSGRKFYAQSARLRARGSYNNVLTVGANPEGMYVSVFVLFRSGHPPLFIPWEDVSAEAKRVRWVNVVILNFARCPDIPFWISRKLANQLEQASGVQFISESNT
jgi:hypothetical protein